MPLWDPDPPSLGEVFMLLKICVAHYSYKPASCSSSEFTWPRNARQWPDDKPWNGVERGDDLAAISTRYRNKDHLNQSTWTSSCRCLQLGVHKDRSLHSQVGLLGAAKRHWDKRARTADGSTEPRRFKPENLETKHKLQNPPFSVEMC